MAENPDQIMDQSSRRPKKTTLLIVLMLAIFSIIFLVISLSSKKSSLEIAAEQAQRILENKSNWQPFTSVAGGFTVSFPVYPVHRVDSAKYPGTDIAISQDNYTAKTANGYYYSVSVFQYSVPIASVSSESSLENALNFMVLSDKDNKLTSSEFSDFQGRRAVDYVIENERLGAILRGKTVITGEKKAVGIMALYKKDEDNTYEYQKFVNSFYFTSIE